VAPTLNEPEEGFRPLNSPRYAKLSEEHRRATVTAGEYLETFLRESPRTTVDQHEAMGVRKHFPDLDRERSAGKALVLFEIRNDDQRFIGPDQIKDQYLALRSIVRTATEVAEPSTDTLTRRFSRLSTGSWRLPSRLSDTFARRPGTAGLSGAPAGPDHNRAPSSGHPVEVPLPTSGPTGSSLAIPPVVDAIARQVARAEDGRPGDGTPLLAALTSIYPTDIYLGRGTGNPRDAGTFLAEAMAAPAETHLVHRLQSRQELDVWFERAGNDGLVVVLPNAAYPSGLLLSVVDRHAIWRIDPAGNTPPQPMVSADGLTRAQVLVFDRCGSVLGR
jgi:hypothetical protein